MPIITTLETRAPCSRSIARQHQHLLARSRRRPGCGQGPCCRWRRRCRPAGSPTATRRRRCAGCGGASRPPRRGSRRGLVKRSLMVPSAGALRLDRFQLAQRLRLGEPAPAERPAAGSAARSRRPGPASRPRRPAAGGTRGSPHSSMSALTRSKSTRGSVTEKYEQIAHLSEVSRARQDEDRQGRRNDHADRDQSRERSRAARGRQVGARFGQDGARQGAARTAPAPRPSTRTCRTRWCAPPRS